MIAFIMIILSREQIILVSNLFFIYEKYQNNNLRKNQAYFIKFETLTKMKKIQMKTSFLLTILVSAFLIKNTEGT